MDASLYMKTLELGYKNGVEGLSFNEVVEKLNINLSNYVFEVNFAIWFYSNFYNVNFEYTILALNNATTDIYHLNDTNYKSLKKHNNEKSFIKGDSLNKYIDYLELKRTRKSSINATILAFASLLLALLSIVIPIIFNNIHNPTENNIKTNYRNECQNHCSKDSSSSESRTKKMNNTETNTTAKLDSIN